MTFKTISAIAILSAALSGPVFAQNTRVYGPNDDNPTYSLRHYRGTYNQAPVNEPFYGGPQVLDNGSVEGNARDPSRIGGEDPYLRPSGS